jgi:stress response protein YsnF
MGSLSGLYTVGSADDRYRAADAERDLRLRDERLDVVKGRVAAVEHLAERIDNQGSRTATPTVAAELEAIRLRLSALEHKVGR